MESTVKAFIAAARGRLLAALRPTPQVAALKHFARAEVDKSRGDFTAAARSYRKAFDLDPLLVEAHAGLAGLTWPGPDYLAWLEHFHAIRRPRVYLEIGVQTGRTLALAQPPTCAIGVDPNATIQAGFKTETHLYCETSNEFFGAGKLARLLHGNRVDFGFIDGLHLFEQVLRDFINLEACCAAESLILLHDTIPLDERTQDRVVSTNFYTGDVWKIVPCLRHYRPDLRVVTIAAAPTGLTAVTRLDPNSRVLADRYDEAVARFMAMPYAQVAADLRSLLNIVPNEWEQAQLRDVSA